MTTHKKITGWKQCWVVDAAGNTVKNKRTDRPIVIYVKLQILGQVIEPLLNTWNTNGIGKKRTDKAKVLEIQGLKEGQQAVSMKEKRDYGREFVYAVGMIVSPQYALDTYEHSSCGSGINYFSTKKEAKAYTFSP